MRANLIILTLLTAAVLGAVAREKEIPDVPPPKAPFVAPIQANADWTVTLQYPSALHGSAKANGRLTEVHSTKTGNYKRDRVAYAGKPDLEYWFVNALALREDAQGEVSVNEISTLPMTATDMSPSVASGYPGMAWLSMEHYDKVVMREKRTCYHFVFDKIEAWVDAEEHLPVAYEANGIVFRFTFNPPPNAPLVLPPAFQKAYDFCEGAIDRRKATTGEAADKPPEPASK